MRPLIGIRAFLKKSKFDGAPHRETALMERSVVSNQYSTSFVEIHKNTYLGHLPNINQI